mmetsp:Transcript_23300/g.38349  ORF Transcript_23300/g.38349 Transcript_23300/m.38349 type:complete len:175 (+) Transcript_23300:265-789(+)
MTVLELGAGPYMPVKEFLPPGSRHIAADLVKRAEDALVVDLNLSPGEVGRPNKDGDSAVSLESIRAKMPESLRLMTMLGVMEYVVDVPRLWTTLRTFNAPVLMTYNALELWGDMEVRKRQGWINHLSVKDLTNVFHAHNFWCEKMVGAWVWLAIPTDKGDKRLRQSCKEIAIPY